MFLLTKRRLPVQYPGMSDASKKPEPSYERTAITLNPGEATNQVVDGSCGQIYLCRNPESAAPLTDKEHSKTGLPDDCFIKVRQVKEGLDISIRNLGGDVFRVSIGKNTDWENKSAIEQKLETSVLQNAGVYISSFERPSRPEQCSADDSRILDRKIISEDGRQWLNGPGSVIDFVDDRGDRRSGHFREAVILHKHDKATYETRTQVVSPAEPPSWISRIFGGKGKKEITRSIEKLTGSISLPHSEIVEGGTEEAAFSIIYRYNGYPVPEDTREGRSRPFIIQIILPEALAHELFSYIRETPGFIRQLVKSITIRRFDVGIQEFETFGPCREWEKYNSSGIELKDKTK